MASWKLRLAIGFKCRLNIIVCTHDKQSMILPVHVMLYDKYLVENKIKNQNPHLNIFLLC